MNGIRRVIFVFGIFMSTICAQEIRVTVSVNTSLPSYTIPENFIGFSFETRRELYNSDGVKGYFFDSSNEQAITLFKQLGVKSVRVGGGSVDNPNTPIPTLKDIDALFRFAKAAGVTVIYSLRLENGDPEQDASIAKYIWDNYKDYLDCFSIGNEPEHYIHEYAVYGIQWKRIADAIVKAVPEAKFCGPSPVSSMDGGANFINGLVKDFAKTGWIKYASAHDYPGGSSYNAGDGTSGRDQMLSRSWLDHYKIFYDQFVPTVQQYGIPYKYDEGSSYYKGGAKEASDTFAASLWCLDYMHWWAAHGCAGYNFHNNRWFMYNITICKDSNENYQVRPQGYGIKAFDMGGHGRVVPAVSSRPSVNMTNYGVMDSDFLYVTLINKEHDEHGRNFDVTIIDNNDDLSNDVQVMYLTAPKGNVAAKRGITFGGATINNTGTWQGKWSPLQVNDADGIKILMKATSAAVLKIKLKK